MENYPFPWLDNLWSISIANFWFLPQASPQRSPSPLGGWAASIAYPRLSEGTWAVWWKTLGGNHAASATMIYQWKNHGKMVVEWDFSWDLPSGICLHTGMERSTMLKQWYEYVQILLRLELNHISVKSGRLRWDLLSCFMFMMWAATAITKPVAQQFLASFISWALQGTCKMLA